jgi:excisionase family DNA binding protein
MAMATTIPDLYDCQEAGEYLGIDPSLVRRYCIDGRIDGEKVGSVWVIRKAELDRFAALPRKVGNPNFGSKSRARKKA